MSLPRSAFRDLVLRQLSRIEVGCLQVKEGDMLRRFGDTDAPNPITLKVLDAAFYRNAALFGDLGAAESYIQEQWDTPDLTGLMRLFSQNAEALSGVVGSSTRLLRPLRSAVNWFRRNTPSGSRRNISAHYDLSNEFFALMLDPTMTYSSGVFPREDASMEEASVEKYDRVCRKLQLSEEDHVLEIGTGWGGFAEHAVTNYGCRVTTTTISRQQHDYAAARFTRMPSGDRITLLDQDYRALSGKFDKLVSIEMIEAVGEKYLPTYFETCSSLLKDDGQMVLQAITIPDCRYDAYRKGVDFIQRYIFPGGFLPSVGAIGKCLGASTDMSVMHAEDFGPHYAETLSRWSDRFWSQVEDVKQLGFDDRFIRTWNYYLSYCEAGFRERQIGVSQWLFAKPKSRRDALLLDL